MRGPAKPDADPLIAPVAGFCHIVCALGHPAATLPLYSAIPPGDGQVKLRRWRIAVARFVAAKQAEIAEHEKAIAEAKRLIGAARALATPTAQDGE